MLLLQFILVAVSTTVPNRNLTVCYKDATVKN